MEVWTIKKILDWSTDYFKKLNTEWPHLEAEILLAHALQLKRIELYTNHERILTKEELAAYKKLVERRSQKEPIAYITNNQPFMSLDMYVDPTVLIPRPETELMVELIIDQVKKEQKEIKIADIGTGSGCIAVSLAKYLPQVKVIGIDRSNEAIVVAHKNAAQHGLEARCEFKIGNLYEPLQEKVDIIVSNPPYIKRNQINQLAKDIKIWEPRKALDGGTDGLDHIKELIKQAPDHLNPGGEILIEIGFDQGAAVKELAKKQPKLSDPRVIKDLNKKDRIFTAAL